jgi:hypothetical protein
MRRAIVLFVALALAGCGSASDPSSSGISNAGNTTARTNSASNTGLPRAHPQAIEPTAGDAGVAAAPQTETPVGDPSAHAPPLSEVKQELKLELVAVSVTNDTYIDPLRYVSLWERTDQGVDAQMPIGAPILAPSRVKILAVIPNWYAGQPLVYFELLDGPEAGRIQYVAEEITSIARPGLILQQGQAIARYARSGTGIEYGWSTINGVTLAMATTGYEEGQVTPAGRSIRNWLNSLGANAGNG